MNNCSKRHLHCTTYFSPCQYFFVIFFDFFENFFTHLSYFAVRRNFLPKKEKAIPVDTAFSPQLLRLQVLFPSCVTFNFALLATCLPFYHQKSHLSSNFVTLLEILLFFEKRLKSNSFTNLAKVWTSNPRRGCPLF